MARSLQIPHDKMIHTNAAMASLSRSPLLSVKTELNIITLIRVAFQIFFHKAFHNRLYHVLFSSLPKKGYNSATSPMEKGNKRTIRS